jgi:hypothetical protein
MTKKQRRQIGRTPAKLTNGGFRAGKRRKGNSLLKQAPKQSATVKTYYMQDEHGNTLGTVKTLTYKQGE